MNFMLASVFLDMLGMGLVLPVLPSLIGEFAASHAQQAAYFGWLVAIFCLMQFVFMPVLGAVSDSIGRRPVLMVSLAGVGVNFLSTAFAHSLPVLVFGRVIGGMSAASLSVAFAYAADVSDGEARSRHFGKIGAALGLGLICGPVVGGLLATGNLRLPFLVAAALCALNFVFAAIFLPESLPPENRKPVTLARLNPFARFSVLTDTRAAFGLVAAFVLVAMAQALLQSVWVLYTQFRFGWNTGETGAALFCVGLASAVAQAVLLGPLVKQYGRARLILLGLASGALVFAGYGLAGKGWMIYALACSNLLAYAASPALQSMISERHAVTRQGELMGALQALASLGNIFMPLLGSWVIQTTTALHATGWRAGSVFFVGAALYVLAIVVGRRHLLSPSAAPTQPAPSSA